MDVYSAHKSVTEVIAAIQCARTDTELYDKLFTDMAALTDLEKPRTASRQTLRANPEVDGVKEYIKVAFLFPYVDHLLSDLNARFSSSPCLTSGEFNKKLCFVSHMRSTSTYFFLLLFYFLLPGFALLPSVLKATSSREEWRDQLQPFLTKYSSDLPSTFTTEQELHLWHNLWSDGREPLTELSAAYAYTLNSINFPNINILLKILITIPVTSASTERANSVLKFVKTSRRTTMSQMTLNAMVLGYKHKGLLCSVPLAEYVDAFIRRRRRRLYLVNPLAE